MGEIAIRLNPALLDNPDADLRYRVPDVIQEATSGQVRGDGYDYGDDNMMTIFLMSNNPERDVELVIQALGSQKICDNQLLDSAVIGTSNDHQTYSIVYPTDSQGQTFIVRT